MRIGRWLFLLLLSQSLLAKTYQVDHNKSSIKFSGQHIGQDFSGEFKKWQAEIRFDEDELTNSHFKVIVNTPSATTGNPMYDGSLKEVDWFDSTEIPKSVFTSQSFNKVNDNTFEVNGNFQLRDVTLPLTFKFNLTDLNQPPVTAKATFKINRLDYNIGKGSDPSAEWVSNVITIQLHIIANPKP